MCLVGRFVRRTDCPCELRLELGEQRAAFEQPKPVVKPLRVARTEDLIDRLVEYLLELILIKLVAEAMHHFVQRRLQFGANEIAHVRSLVDLVRPILGQLRAREQSC